jgi:hypothetical protein
VTDLFDPPKPSARPVGDGMLDVAAAADVLGISAGALRVRMSRGTGPPSIRRGGRRMIPAAGLAVYAANETEQTT